MDSSSSAMEEDRNYSELWRNARKLSATDIQALETILLTDPFDMNARVQVFAYYNEYDKNKLKHANAEEKLYEQVLWFIKNKPSVRGFLGHRLHLSAHSFKPKAFASLRQAWLNVVSASPPDGAILGNAALFISWNDLETAYPLVEKAYVLQPNAGWLGMYLTHCNSELWNSPEFYKNAHRELIISVGLRSLETEGSRFSTCEVVSDAALELGRLDIVRLCAEIMNDLSDRGLKQEAQAYLGLVALRENKPAKAIRLMQNFNQPMPAVFRLAKELFDTGERDAIVDFVRHLGRRIKKCAKERWLAQIQTNERPDFKDWCLCKTCRNK